MENKKEKIVAVIVTYNRKDSLTTCISALLHQTYTLDAIIIIDNSAQDGTPERLKDCGYIFETPPKNLIKPWGREFVIPDSRNNKLVKLYYVRMHENTGGAGGFCRGIQEGYEKGYDWIWTMDDDGMPTENCLENLLSYREDFDFISPLVVDIDNKQKLAFGQHIEKNKFVTDVESINKAKKDFFMNIAAPFNGILINKHLISKIGYPRKEFFIYGDETEYLMRTLYYGLRVAMITNAIFLHPKCKLIYKTVLLGRRTVFMGTDLSMYCLYRNNFHIFRTYKGKIFTIRWSIGEFIKRLLLFDFHGFKIALIAILDAIRNIWGREKDILIKNKKYIDK